MKKILLILSMLFVTTILSAQSNGNPFNDAHAIAKVDAAIYDNAHPGEGWYFDIYLGPDNGSGIGTGGNSYPGMGGWYDDHAGPTVHYGGWVFNAALYASKIIQDPYIASRMAYYRSRMELSVYDQAFYFCYTNYICCMDGRSSSPKPPHAY